MVTRSSIVIAIILIIAGAFIAYAAQTMQVRKKNLSKKQKVTNTLKRFDFYYDFIPTRNMFRKMYMQVGNLAVYNYIESHVVSVQFFERSMVMAIVIFVVGIVGFQDLVSATFALAFAVVILQNNIQGKIDEVNFRTYQAMSALLGSLRETYARTHSVADSLNECMCPEILQLQVDKIYKIVTAVNGNHLLSEFYEECPNRIMKTLATTCYIRNDTGEDKSVGSPFKDALGLIKDEVDMEMRRQYQQRLLFKSLDRLPFVPLFLYPAIVLAYGKILPATTAVFQSFWGYIIKLAIIIVALTCFYILTTINNASVAAIDDRNDLIKSMIARPYIKKFAKTLVPRHYKKRSKIEDDMQGCLSSKDIEYLYLEKFIYMCLFGVIMCIISIFVVIASRTSVYNSTQAVTMTSTLTLTKSQKEQMLELDADILKQPEAPNDDDGQLTKRVKKIVPLATDLDLDSQVTRIKDKYNTYHNLHFWWWFGILYVLAGVLGWYLPNIMLRLRVAMVKEEATLDVLQLQTVIAILMDTPMDTMTVIYWMMRSSDIHRNILADCYNMYPRDPEDSIQRLKEAVTIPEFVQICDKLKLTIFQISMLEAFEDLVKDRASVMKIREMTQEAELKAKRNKASPIAMAPMVTWIVLCFVLPIVVITINSAVSLMSKLKGVFS